jgi:hypothetical protein
MTNPYFNADGSPAQSSQGASAVMRTEFANIAAAFDKMPLLTANTAVVVNGAGTALTNTTGSLALGGPFATTGAFSTNFTQQANVTLILPPASDTLVGRATTDIFTNKTFDTAGAGNVFKVNGTQISAVTGTGSVVLGTSPSFTNSITVSSGTPVVNLVGTAASGQRGYNIKQNSTTLSEWLAEPSTGEVQWRSGIASFGSFQTWYIDGTERMRLTNSGSLVIGATAPGSSAKMFVSTPTGNSFGASNTDSTAYTGFLWNLATSGDNLLLNFSTDAGAITRGGVSYNRAGGVIVYGTTCDYRSKVDKGLVTGAAAIVDSVPVHLVRQIGATVDRVAFLAHEAQSGVPAAVTGEKDAVEADGKPIFQQLDSSEMVATLWAALQETRKELASLRGRVLPLDPAP